MVAAKVLSIEPAWIRPMRRSEYDRLIGFGAFEGERVELIRGALVEMSPQNVPHASTIQQLEELLGAQVRGRFTLRTQLPLALSSDSQPEPDIAVVARGRYRTGHPRTALLVIEVADTSIRADRTKTALYAGASVNEYWIINVNAGTVDAYSSPTGGHYTEIRSFGSSDVLRPIALPDVAISMAELLAED